MHTIYFRFIFTRIPFNISDISDRRAIIYLFLIITFTSILLSIYYHFFRTYILKKPINENSKIFKIKKFFEDFLEKYGPTAALKAFFATIMRRDKTLYIEDILWFFIRLLIENRFIIFDKYYYHALYLIFIGLPRIVVATMFVIDVCYYEHIELFFKWSLLLGIPLIFNTTLGILKLFNDENLEFYQHVISITTMEDDDITVEYSDPAYYETIGPLSTFLTLYFRVKSFINTYNLLQKMRHKYIFVTIYTIHCYLIGWIYALYFYGPNFYSLLLTFF